MLHRPPRRRPGRTQCCFQCQPVPVAGVQPVPAAGVQPGRSAGGLVGRNQCCFLHHGGGRCLHYRGVGRDVSSRCLHYRGVGRDVSTCPRWATLCTGRTGALAASTLAAVRCGRGPGAPARPVQRRGQGQACSGRVTSARPNPHLCASSSPCTARGGARAKARSDGHIRTRPWAAETLNSPPLRTSFYLLELGGVLPLSYSRLCASPILRWAACSPYPTRASAPTNLAAFGG